jgi:hypothetical protein
MQKEGPVSRGHGACRVNRPVQAMHLQPCQSPVTATTRAVMKLAHVPSATEKTGSLHTSACRTKDAVAYSTPIYVALIHRQPQIFRC